MGERRHKYEKSSFSVKKSNTYYERLLDNINEGFITLDTELRYTFINKNASLLSGLEPEKVIGKYIGEVFPDAEQLKIYQAIKQASRDQSVTCCTEYFEPLHLWLETTVYPCPEGFALFVKDISSKKQAEELVLKGQQRLRSIIAHSGDIIILCDQNQVFTYVSPSFETLTGYLKEEVIGKTNLLEIFPELMELIRDVIPEIINSPGVSVQRLNRIKHKKGHWIWLEGIITNLLHDSAIESIVCNYHDITERKESEIKLRESELLYRSLFENLQHGAIYCEAIFEKERVIDYIYISANKAHELVTGYHGLTGKRCREVFPEIDKLMPDYFDWITRVCMYGKTETHELFIEEKLKWFSISISSPKEGYFVALIDDVTQKKEYNNQQALFAAIVSSSQDAIFSRDKEGYITTWNNSAEKMFGYKVNEAIGMHITKLIPVNRKPEWHDIFHKIKNGERVNQFETERETKTGELIHISLTISPIEDRNGQPNGASVIARNISERKLAEEKIKQSENNLSTIIENSTEAFVLTDNKFVIKAFNTRARESVLLQFGREPIREGCRFLDHIHPERKENLKNVLLKVLTGEHINFESDFYHKEGQPFWFLANFIPVKENHLVTGVCIAVKDITNRKMSEAKIRRSEENLRAIVENSNQGYILINLESKVQLTNVNAVKFGLLAYNKIITAGHSIYDFIELERVDTLKELISRVIKGEKIMYSRVFEPAGRPSFWLEFLLSPVYDNNQIVTGVCITGSDITEKKLVEQRREFEQSNLKSLINNTGDLMWSVDRNYCLITCNQPFADLIHTITGKIVERGDNMLIEEFGENTVSRYRSFYSHAFAGHSFIETDFLEFPEPTWSEISFHPIRNGKEIVGTACFSRNVTGMRKSNLEKENLIKELSQNNKDLQQFAYITSHNLRGPIANLLGLCNLLNKYKPEEPTLLKILDGIQLSAVHFDETIRDLSDILTIKDNRAVKQEICYFSDSFKHVFLQYKALLENCHALVYTDFYNAPEVLFNRAYLESILVNLLTNSIKYKDYVRPLEITIRTEKSGNSVLLTFSDNGIGLDVNKHKAKIFQLYQRFHDGREGKGLGLFLIKSQLESLGGTIDIESEENKGTKFKLTFRNTL